MQCFLRVLLWGNATMIDGNSLDDASKPTLSKNGDRGTAIATPARNDSSARGRVPPASDSTTNFTSVVSIHFRGIVEVLRMSMHAVRKSLSKCHREDQMAKKAKKAKKTAKASKKVAKKTSRKK